jgi:hypothetical protein
MRIRIVDVFTGRYQAIAVFHKVIAQQRVYAPDYPKIGATICELDSTGSGQSPMADHANEAMKRWVQ